MSWVSSKDGGKLSIYLHVNDGLGIIVRLFDHWAHLSGALFGVLYYIYGPEFWNQLRAAHVEAERRRDERQKRDESEKSDQE